MKHVVLALNEEQFKTLKGLQFWKAISENSRKLYVADLANDVHCNFLPEALMNTTSSYEAVYWLERISYNFLIWSVWSVNFLKPNAHCCLLLENCYVERKWDTVKRKILCNRRVKKVKILLFYALEIYQHRSKTVLQDEIF